MAYSGKPKRATPEQMAKFGHIAANIRAGLKDRGWSIMELNRQLGHKGPNSGPYVWLAAKGGPGTAAQVKLSKLFGPPPEDFRPRELSSQQLAVATSKKTDMVRIEVPGRQVVPPAPKPNDVLRFAVAANGDCRVQLDVTLHYSKGMPLVRMLMDAGVVLSNDGEAAE